jgi:hypothetical protein
MQNYTHDEMAQTIEDLLEAKGINTYLLIGEGEVEQGFINEKGGENLIDVLADAMIADEEFMTVCTGALEIATAELNKGN